MIWNWLRRHPRLVDVVLVLALGAGYVGNAAHNHHWMPGVPLAARRSRRCSGGGATPAGRSPRSRRPGSRTSGRSGIRADRGGGRHLHRRGESPAHRCTTGRCDRGSEPPRSSPLAHGGSSRALSDLDSVRGRMGRSATTSARDARTRASSREARERLEREQESEAARAVAEEQARIARELHDVIAHTVSVIVVQAAAANDVFDARPERAREALRADRGDAAGRALASCGACSASSAATTPTSRHRPGSTVSTSSSRRCAQPGSRLPSASKERRVSCRRASICPRTASCRRP